METKHLVLLGHFDDRRTFDLYNAFNSNPLWVCVVFFKSAKPWVQALYPNAKCIQVANEAQKQNWLNEVQEPSIWLPFTEEEIEWYYQMGENWNKNLACLMPDKVHWETARDKQQFVEFFQDTNWVPTLFKSSEKGSYPDSGTWVIKPRLGKGAIGKRVLSFSDNWDLVDLESNTVQEFIGDGKSVVGFFAFAMNGKTINSYQHKRIKTYPEEGGVSTQAQRFYSEEVQKAGESMLERLEWSGVVMIEFLYDTKAGSWKAIECNPRLWGTCLLGEIDQTGPIRAYLEKCSGKHVQEQNSPFKNLNIEVHWWFPYAWLEFVKNPIRHWKTVGKRKGVYYMGKSLAGYRAFAFALSNVLSPKKWTTLFKKLGLLR